VKQQILIVPVLAAAALASGCASWDAHDRSNDYQCGSAPSNEGHYGAFAGRPPGPECGENLETLAASRKISIGRTIVRHERQSHNRDSIARLIRVALSMRGRLMPRSLYRPAGAGAQEFRRRMFVEV